MPSWKGKTHGGVFGYKFFIFILKYFGISVSYFFLRFVVVYFVLFLPKASKAIYHYFRKAQGFGWFKSIIMVFKNYYVFGQILIDKIAIIAGFEKKFTYTFDANYDELLRILDSGSGCVLISAHIGNWEVAGQFFGHYGNKLNIFMLEAEHERIKNMLDGLLGEKKYKIIGLKEDLSHIIKINTALSNGEYICFQGDRYVNAANTLKANFFGMETLFPAGPFQIASKYSLPVVYFFAMKDAARNYKFIFHISEESTKAYSNKSEKAKQLLSEYTTIFESTVRQYPEQWFNYYNFWENKN